MKLFIIRHAQSTNNALPDERDRVPDPPLTELGHHQAQLLAEHLATGKNPELSAWTSVEASVSHNRRSYDITKLYCSAMHRSLQTAQPIAQALNLTPEIWLDIHEHGGIYLDHGAEKGIVGYPGRTRSEILAEFPTCVLPEAITEEGWWTGGQEDWPSVHGRAIKVVAELRARAASDERIAIVSHGGFIDALIKSLLNQSPSPHVFYYNFNTAISRIDFRDDGRLDFRYLNRVDHLPQELIS
ncbi:MAG TPA: histidine phosphatase family protein [Anaerolineae bacterium]|nr:histidine phosphatase family protein [Anaerolineae bacterium]